MQNIYFIERNLSFIHWLNWTSKHKADTVKNSILSMSVNDVYDCNRVIHEPLSREQI